MSEPPKKKRVSEKKEVESKRVVKEKASRPTGAAPSATVEVRHGGRVMQRQARGYSLGEVAEAGLNFELTRRWGLLVDDRRRSALEDNVASLKKWSPQTKKTREARVEGEVKKIEKAVEKEVRKAKKEVEKVEKEVVEKVEAPVRRSNKKAAAKPRTS